MSQAYRQFSISRNIQARVATSAFALSAVLWTAPATAQQNAAGAQAATDAAAVTTGPTEGAGAGASDPTSATTAPSGTAPTTAAAAPTGGLQDIVVTARKRAESTQNVPVSVTALTAVQIDRQDLTNLERVAATTPQFTVGRAASGSGATLVLRGIGSNSTSIGIEQSVAVVVDGVYYGQGRVINEGFFDLARLELLKGPQALFFGKNATAGVISITSADPGSKPEFMARVGYETRSENLIGEAIASGPLTDTLGLRIAVRGNKMFGGYFRNDAVTQNYRSTDFATGAVTNRPALPGDRDAPGGRELLGRVTLKWKPDNRLTVTLKGSADSNDVNNPASNYVPFNCPSGASQLNPAIKCGKKFVIYQNNFPLDVAKSMRFANDDGSLGDQYKSWALTGTINYALDHLTLTSVTNYNWNQNTFQLDCDVISSSAPPSCGGATERTHFHAFSTEARALTSFDSPVNLMLGVYYQNTKRDYLAYTANGGLENSAAPQPYQRFLGNSKDSQTNGETIAGFGQVIWKVVPKVEVTAGVRYTHETKDSYFIQPYSSPVRVAQGVFSPGVRITANQVFNNWSPEASVTFRPTNNVTLYAAYKTAYKSGGFSNSGIYSPKTTVDADFAFDPEKARGFEAGIKTTLFDRQLRLNVIGYTYKFTNLQIDFFNSPVFAFSTINAGSAKTDGVELEMAYAPRSIAGLTLRGTANYNHARYDKFPNAPCYTGQTPAAGCFTTVPRPTQDLSGVSTAMAPKWTASLGGDYETPINERLTFGLSVDTRYSSSYLGSAFGNPASRQSGYVNLDASARVRTSDDHWELAVIGKNLTNKFYITGAQDAPSTGSGTGTPAGHIADQIGFAAYPRTVQLQLTWRY